MKNWRNVLLMIFIGVIISITSIAQTPDKEDIYNEVDSTFTIEAWIMHQLYRNKDEVPLLVGEIIWRTDKMDSLDNVLSISKVIIDSLTSHVILDSIENTTLSNQVDIMTDLYMNQMELTDASRVMIKAQQKEIIILKRKSLFSAIMDWGYGIFKLKYFTAFSGGYLLSTFINKIE